MISRKLLSAVALGFALLTMRPVCSEPVSIAIAPSSIPKPVLNDFSSYFSKNGELYSWTRTSPQCYSVGTQFRGSVGWFKKTLPVDAADKLNAVTRKEIYLFKIRFKRDGPNADWQAIQRDNAMAPEIEGAPYAALFEMKDGNPKIQLLNNCFSF